MKQTTFGSYIRSLRKQNQMTQAELADKVGVTDKAVSKWERGVSCPDITIYPKLADLFGVTVNDLLRESVEEGPPSRLLQIFEMSHDIRTPLHMILGCVGMAETYTDNKEQLLRYLESIRVSGEYLLAVVERAMQTTGQDGTKQVLSDVGRGTSENTGPADPAAVPGGAGSAAGPGAPGSLEEYLRTRLSSQKDASLRYDFSGIRILVAEDMELNREIAAELLRQTGAAVEFAADGQICLEMVEAAQAGYYDMILMDIRMPRMDGVEATRRIRQLSDSRKASVPIIAMTANVYGKDRREAFEAGMNDFAEKPVFADRLLGMIRKHLRNS